MCKLKLKSKHISLAAPACVALLRLSLFNCFDIAHLREVNCFNVLEDTCRQFIMRRKLCLAKLHKFDI